MVTNRREMDRTLMSWERPATLPVSPFQFFSRPLPDKTCERPSKREETAADCLCSTTLQSHSINSRSSETLFPFGEPALPRWVLTPPRGADKLTQASPSGVWLCSWRIFMNSKFYRWIAWPERIKSSLSHKEKFGRLFLVRTKNIFTHLAAASAPKWKLVCSVSPQSQISGVIRGWITPLHVQG